MYIEQLYTNCLAEAAYYIESDGECAIVDPIRETDQYVQMASSRGASIKYILETHFHADFISGHLDLAASTGAEIVFGPGAETNYHVHLAKDGELLHVGKITIEVLHTPGHTPESVCYLVRDEEGTATAVFTGDTLFVGDVGRPDLLDGKMTKEALGGMMYDSLRTKLAPLADDIVVYPGHGPGSSCGKNIGKEKQTTIGAQRKANYALRGADGAMTRDEFIAALTNGLSAPPKYYFKDAAINKRGYEPLRDVMSRNSHALSVEELASQLKAVLVLDVREPAEFEVGHVPGAVNIGLSGNYAQWVGTLLNIETKLAIVAPLGKEEESIRRLARVGYENVTGYLEGGFEAWQAAGKTVETTVSIEPDEFRAHYFAGQPVLDVRNVGEYESGHVDGAKFIPLAQLEDRIAELDPNVAYLVHCGVGYRSMIAMSLLARHGFKNTINVRGGFSKMRAFVEEKIVKEQGVLA